MAATDPTVITMPDEKIVCQDDEVTYLSPVGACTGTLILTSFKLVFLAPAHTRIDVLLGLVERIEKVGGQKSSKGEHGYGFEVHCRDLRTLRFAYRADTHSRRGTFDSIRQYAFPKNQQDLFCFRYQLPVKDKAGWKLYDFEREMKRQGIPNQMWRISRANSSYELCNSYPALLAVPADITDDMLREAAAFRSRGRLAALCWLHPRTQATITRCSQPKVGIVGKRSPADESLLTALRTHNPTDKARLVVLDARPKRNAVANQAKGMGFESDTVYTDMDMTFLDIYNIYVMRQSLQKMKELCSPDADDHHWLANLDATGWFKHAKRILSGAMMIVETVERGRSVLVHCSDGWDRTSQLTALAMLILDPFYRTVTGFMVLIEKEWLSFGHKFHQRLGLGEDNHTDDQRSPVFLQFIDCVWQIMQQFPCAFQFNEHMLVTILDHMYSCLFGTFLFNSEQARVMAKLPETTYSLWDFINLEVESFTNPLYAPAMTPDVLPVSARMSSLQLWSGYFLRWNPSHRPHESIEERVKSLNLLCHELEKENARLKEQVDKATHSDS